MTIDWTSESILILISFVSFHQNVVLSKSVELDGAWSSKVIGASHAGKFALSSFWAQQPF